MMTTDITSGARVLRSLNKELPQIPVGAHAPGGGDRAAHRLLQGRQPPQSRAGEGAVGVNVCKDDMLYPNGFHGLGELEVVQPLVPHPAAGADMAVLGVDAHGDLFRTVAGDGLSDEVRVADGGGADDRPPDPQ